MNPWKPWFVFRPSQVVRRLTFRPTSAYRRLTVAWGEQLLALDDEHIGRCLGTTGIYDLAVSELLFRLIHPGDLVVDAGANIGYMSVLAATAGARVDRVRTQSGITTRPSSEPRHAWRRAPGRAWRAASYRGAHSSRSQTPTTTASAVSATTANLERFLSRSRHAR